MPVALITGASKGIGRAIASQLAARGNDVWLVARNEAQLQQAALEIEAQHGVKARYFVADLSQPDAPKQVYDWCLSQGVGVEILVNNAGYGLSGPFEQHSLEEHLNMMQVNMGAVVTLTYLFLPMLKKSSKAYILNIASSAGYQATPYLSLYAASKSFVRLFSRGLHEELKRSAVSLTCVNPGATDTAFVDRAQIGKKGRDLAKKVQMSPEQVARLAVSAMYAGKTEVITGVVNKLGAFLVWLLPKKMIESSAAKIYQ
jgi:short-subunit dehydrogenase